MVLLKKMNTRAVLLSLALMGLLFACIEAANAGIVVKFRHYFMSSFALYAVLASLAILILLFALYLALFDKSLDGNVKTNSKILGEHKANF